MISVYDIYYTEYMYSTYMYKVYVIIYKYIQKIISNKHQIYIWPWTSLRRDTRGAALTPHTAMDT